MVTHREVRHEGGAVARNRSTATVLDLGAEELAFRRFWKNTNAYENKKLKFESFGAKGIGVYRVESFTTANRRTDAIIIRVFPREETISFHKQQQNHGTAVTDYLCERADAKSVFSICIGKFNANEVYAGSPTMNGLFVAYEADGEMKVNTKVDFWLLNYLPAKWCKAIINYTFSGVSIPVAEPLPRKDNAPIPAGMLVADCDIIQPLPLFTEAMYKTLAENYGLGYYEENSSWYFAVVTSVLIKLMYGPASRTFLGWVLRGNTDAIYRAYRAEFAMYSPHDKAALKECLDVCQCSGTLYSILDENDQTLTTSYFDITPTKTLALKSDFLTITRDADNAEQDSGWYEQKIVDNETTQTANRATLCLVPMPAPDGYGLYSVSVDGKETASVHLVNQPSVKCAMFTIGGVSWVIGETISQAYGTKRMTCTRSDAEKGVTSLSILENDAVMRTNILTAISRKTITLKDGADVSYALRENPPEIPVIGIVVTNHEGKVIAHMDSDTFGGKIAFSLSCENTDIPYIIALAMYAHMRECK